MVGIDNIRKTFPLAYCYITSESAETFKWIAEQLTDLVFYDCPEAAVIVGDFSAGLGKAITEKAKLDYTENTVPRTQDQVLKSSDSDSSSSNSESGTKSTDSEATPMSTTHTDSSTPEEFSFAENIIV
jgi:hypothetical protein